MTKYEGRLYFGSDIVPDEAREEWVEGIRASLPEGATFDLKVIPFTLPIEDVTDAHAGTRVRVYTGKTGGEVQGILEHVYITGHTPDLLGRTLVINGKAYAIPVYATVEMGDW